MHGFEIAAFNIIKSMRNLFARLPMLARMLASSICLLVISTSAYALNPGDITFTLATGNSTLTTQNQKLIVDSNDCANSGPRGAFVGGRFTNTTGATMNGIAVSLGGFDTAQGFNFSGGQAPSQFIGSLGPAESKNIYWFIQYDCAQDITDLLDLTISDDLAGTDTLNFSVTTTSSISAAAGGVVAFSALGAGAIVGQIIEMDVTYEFGNTGNGDEFYIQPAGNTNFKAGCFQLVGVSIVTSAADAIAAGTQDKLWFEATSNQGGSGKAVAVKYRFLYLCDGVSTSASSYAAQTSGGGLKYTGNFGQAAFNVSYPAAVNPYTIGHTASPNAFTAGAVAPLVTYTVTINNTSSFDGLIDAIVGELPAGALFKGIQPGSDITAANSSTVPALDAGGSITFLGKSQQTYPVAANSSIQLIYNVELPTGDGAYANSVAASIGQSSTPSATAYVSVGTGTDGNVSMTANIAVGDTLFIQVSDFDLDTNSGVIESIVVDVVNDVSSELEQVTLTETGINTAVFTGSLATGSGAGNNNNGVLSVSVGQTATVTYVDAYNASGTPANRTSLANITAPDSDGDGISDDTDIDADNDGIPNSVETITLDTDGDGVLDYLDLDSDNDGIADLIESGSSIALALDVDGDGQIDVASAVGSDGLADALQAGGDTGALNYTLADTDVDGVNNFIDLDSDNDSLGDLLESGLSSAQLAALDTDSDGDIDTPIENVANAVGDDGIVDSLQGGVDGDPLGFSVSDTDGDSIADFLDLDADADGIPDLIEAGNSAAIALDTNGDGRIALAESAVGADGIADAAQGGADGGTLPAASNSDAGIESAPAIADYRDLDSDNDGLFDASESGGVDANGDAIADGTDSNGDGMIDSGFVISPVDTLPLDSPDYQNNSNTLAGNTDADGDGIVDSPNGPDDLFAHGVLPVAAVLVIESGGTTAVDESGAGNTDSFSVVLQRQPSADVVLNIGSSDSGEATVAPATLTFTAANWDTPQTVTVTGVADNFIDGSMPVTLSAAVDDTLSATEYAGLTASVAATVADTTTDTDGDGISDVTEGALDSDGDGTPDASDPDSDNDGIPDAVEAGSDPEVILDSDGDGSADYIDRDSDNDGILDVLEVGQAPGTPLDSDGDMLADYLDSDSDNDGLPDYFEDTNSPPLSGIDTQGGSPGGNGIDDNVDAFVTLGADLNGNGVDDNFEPSNNDADTRFNHLDLDSDGDGILDIVEASNVPAPSNVDSDNDGIDNAYDFDLFPGGSDANSNGIEDSVEARDSDADGVPDYLDIDSDNDSVPDSVESGISVAHSGIDSDGDGIDNAFDVDVVGGSDVNLNGIEDGVEVRDSDGDGVPDYLDLDSDNDGLMDIAESGSTDADVNGLIDSLADEGSNSSPLNSDGDSLVDMLDLESSNSANDNSGPFDIASDPRPAANAASFDSAPVDGQLDNPADSDGDGIADSIDDLNGRGVLPSPGILLTPSGADTTVNESGTLLDTLSVVLTSPPLSDVVIDISSADAAEATALSAGLPALTFTAANWDTPQTIDVSGVADDYVDGTVIVNLLFQVDAAASDNLYDGLSQSSSVSVLDTTLDTDGDGISDAIEAANSAASGGDSDGDGVVDSSDTDSDNDGIPDALEAGSNPELVRDTDGDSAPDYLDRDADNDRILDLLEAGADPNNPRDTDADLIPDYIDSDSDSDGIPDHLENTATPALSGVDTVGAGVGGNGIDDNIDVLFTNGDDLNVNGVDDLYEPVNTDGDAKADYRDLDSDADGIIDVIEADNLPTISGVDTDNDGIDDAFDVDEFTAGSDANANGVDDSVDPRDSDADGKADFVDLDSDNDSVPDSIEAGVTPIFVGQDSDADGIDNAIDVNVVGGPDLNGNGVRDSDEPRNTDGDSSPDYRDLDSDNDGLMDIGEAGTVDVDLNGLIDTLADEASNATPTNSDGDALPNMIDLESSDASNDGIAPFDIESDPRTAVDAASFDTAPADGQLDSNVDSDGDGIADVVDDLDGPGVLPEAALLITESAGNTAVSENGGVDSFAVVLQRQPTADVVIAVASADTGEATVAPATLTYTALNWNIAQTVTVTGVADNFVDGSILVNLALNVTSTDSLYHGSASVVVVTVGDATPDADGDGIADVIEGSVDTDNDGTPDSADSDSDNDGIPDAVEAGSNPEIIPDADADGIPDYREIDADNDGIIDALEVGPAVMIPLDTDNDGIPDYLDSDSDNDGIPDVIEDTNTPALSGVDSVGNVPGEGNGIDDAIDVLVTGGVDNNSNGVDDAMEPADADGNVNAGTPNHLSLDSDGDGLLDILEVGGLPAPVGIDSDGDGIDNSIDVDATNGEDVNGNGLDDALEPRDSDGDGIPDYLDIDSDNDGIPDSVEAAASGGSLPTLSGVDSDADGIDDAVDADNGGSPIDLNGNGISDNAEPVDSDGDGQPDALDLDADNDSVLDIFEAGGVDNNLDGQVDDLLDQGTLLNPLNSDGDAQPDYRDLESTNPANDGSAYDIDSNPLAGSADTAPRDGRVDDPADADGDGIADSVDLDPNGYGGAQDSDFDMLPDLIDLDADNDGIPNIAEGFDENNPANSTDSDGDGIADYLDLDSDNDGLYDVIEANPAATDLDQDGRVDNFVDLLPTSLEDGLHDAIAVDFNPVDTDADGIADFRDTDSDGDGISDIAESSLDQAMLDNLDPDGNGIIDNYDPATGLVLDILSQAVLLQPLDSDGDGQFNFRDTDSDNDGFSDALESQDTNGNSVFDNREAGTGKLDTSVTGGAGGSGIFSVMGMLLMVLIKGINTRGTVLASRARNALRILRVPGLLLLALFASAVSAVVGADEAMHRVGMDYATCDLRNNSDSSNTAASTSPRGNCYYIGLGYGISHVDPEGQSNGWSTDDNGSNGYELVVGRHFGEHWFGEFKYADIGEAGLGNTNAAADAAYPDANISYRVPSLMAGYYLRAASSARTTNSESGISNRFNLYGKVGISVISNAAHDDAGTVDFDAVTSAQLALGIGAEYRPQNSRWFARLNFDNYDRDAWFASVSINARLGDR